MNHSELARLPSRRQQKARYLQVHADVLGSTGAVAEGFGIGIARRVKQHEADRVAGNEPLVGAGDLGRPPAARQKHAKTITLSIVPVFSKSERERLFLCATGLWQTGNRTIVRIGWGFGLVSSHSTSE